MLRSFPPTVVSSLVLLALVACGSPPPAKMTPAKSDDGVAANSASEERLNGDSKPKTTAAPVEDPSQPYTTPLNADPAAASATPTGAGAAAGTGATTAKGGKGGKGPTSKEPKEAKGAAAAGGTGKVSKAECKQLFDKYIDLTVGSDSRFEGIPPEMIAQMKQAAMAQAQSEKGDPCSSQDVSRTQYSCAMASTTTAAWQRCLK